MGYIFDIKDWIGLETCVRMCVYQAETLVVMHVLNVKPFAEIYYME